MLRRNKNEEQETDTEKESKHRVRRAVKALGLIGLGVAGTAAAVTRSKK